MIILINNMNNNLSSLNNMLKGLIAVYLVVLSIGVGLGLTYIYMTTNMTPHGMSEQYLGNDNDWEPQLPKTVMDLVSHSHDHIVFFSIIFFTLGLIFSMTSVINGFWKIFLIFEPFLSILVTFSGFFIIRFINPYFSYIVIISSVLMYACFYIMVLLILYELFLFKDDNY